MDAELEHAVPHVSFDYAYIGQDDEDALPIIVIRDHGSKSTFSHAVPAKGMDKYAIRQCAHSISTLGHRKIILKSDNEPAIMALKHRVMDLLRQEHGMEVIPEECPVDDHQANGTVEHAVGEFAGQTRTPRDRHLQWQAQQACTPLETWNLSGHQGVLQRVLGWRPVWSLQGSLHTETSGFAEI